MKSKTKKKDNHKEGGKGKYKDKRKGKAKLPKNLLAIWHRPRTSYSIVEINFEFFAAIY